MIFFNGIPFLTNFSRKIRMLSVEFITSWTAAHIGRSLMKIVCIYARGGFIVNVVLVYQEFDKIESELELVQINTTASR